MGNWGKPYMIGIYCVIGLGVLFNLDTIAGTNVADKAMIKAYSKFTGITNRSFSGGGSKTKRHKKQKKHKSKKH